MSDSSAEIIEIAEDWPCNKCGYNLRCAAVEGLCPECAAPVRGSFEIRRQPRWSAIAGAAVIVAIGMIIFILTVAITAMPIDPPRLIVDVFDPNLSLSQHHPPWSAPALMPAILAGGLGIVVVGIATCTRFVRRKSSTTTPTDCNPWAS